MNRQPTTADVDVVVVNYNSGEHLPRCLGSVFEAAGDVSVSVVVVDNDSQDGSAQRAKEAFPDIALITNPSNRGFGSASNQGIAIGRADWIFLLNPDAEISVGGFDALLELAGKRPQAAVIGVLVRDPDGSLYPSARKIPSLSEAAAGIFWRSTRSIGSLRTSHSPRPTSFLMKLRSRKRSVSIVAKLCVTTERLPTAHNEWAKPSAI